MRLLIIEDDASLLESLKISLEAESYAVDGCTDGESGSYTARTNDYDLVILDLGLPKKPGVTVCEEIRKAGKKMPILTLSARGEPDLKSKLLDCGADDYITKPFSYQELRSRIRALLRRPKDMYEEILTIDNLIVDTTRQTIKRGKKDIYLTKKEFSLLEFLLRNKSRVVSRGMIMEHVWNIDSDPFSNTIEAHILNLRKKIEAKNWKKLVHNVPGRGYKIDSL
ncbi:MAG TPA: response regulator transcription factor [Candidatus Paceibacterota bacterium]|nr:response regulator transcription factor [Candidatus Paceibacterota bacterium]